MTIVMENAGAQNIVTIYGSSNDAKPTNYAEGSIFIETDTHDVYMFDEENVIWRKM